MPRFISIEGLHGVGKSTIAELVAKEIGVEVTPTIPKEFEVSRRFVSEATSLEARYMLFLSATLSAGEQIKQRFENGFDTVVESYVPRTIAFHEGMGSLLKIAIPEGFFQPTHTVLLTCTPLVRAGRLEGRGGARNKWDVRAEVCQEAISWRYREFGFPCIDTTNLDPQEVAVKVMEVVNVLG